MNLNSWSWKTTVCGLLALVGANLALFWPDHLAKLGGFLAALGSGVGLLFARDNNKSSEDVGARPASSVPIMRPGGGALSLLLATVLAGIAVGGSGCATSNPEGRILVSTAQTVDAGMKGWAIWVADARADAYSETRVKEMYGRYQLAMEGAQTAYTVWQKTGEKNAWERASITLKTTRDKLLNLIDVFQNPVKPPVPTTP